MKNQDIDNTNYDFLKPLQNRTDLEPSTIFTNSLRKKLVNNDTKLKKRPNNVPFWGVSMLAILTACMVIFTLNTNNLLNLNHTTSHPNKPVSEIPTTNNPVIPAEPVTPTYSYDIDLLLANHSYYKKMHQTLLDGKLIDNKAADVFILYLEALKNKDINEVKKYKQHSLTTDTEIEALMEMYQNIDYSSFSIESIIHSKGEPVTEVNLNFKQIDGSLNSSQLYIEFYEDKIRINEFINENTHSKEANEFQQSPEYLAKSEGELSIDDSETAYEMCVKVLTDYYKAVWNGEDIDLDPFIENQNLIQYLQEKIQSQYDVFGQFNNKVKSVGLGAWEVEYTNDVEGGYLYLKLPVNIKQSVGSYGEGTEFLLRNIKGKLVIVDWYTGKKDGYDFMVRGENLTIDNPNIWNDREWIKKINNNID